VLREGTIVINGSEIPLPAELDFLHYCSAEMNNAIDQQLDQPRLVANGNTDEAIGPRRAYFSPKSETM
jgi:hypothetical protein